MLLETSPVQSRTRVMSFSPLSVILFSTTFGRAHLSLGKAGVPMGGGMPLFGEPSEEIALTLVNTIPFESGAIQLIYQKASAQQEQRPDQQSVQ